MSRTGRVFTLSAALMTAMLSSCGGGNKKPVAATAQYADGFSVSDVFSSDMIVQRGENIRIWGWADESQNGRRISGTFMGMTADAVISGGEWELVFRSKSPLPMPVTICVSSQTGPKRFSRTFLSETFTSSPDSRTARIPLRPILHMPGSLRKGKRVRPITVCRYACITIR